MNTLVFKPSFDDTLMLNEAVAPEHGLVPASQTPKRWFWILISEL